MACYRGSPVTLSPSCVLFVPDATMIFTYLFLLLEGLPCPVKRSEGRCR